MNKQRQLTQEELNLAPDWAVEYDNSNAHLIFISKKLGTYRGDDVYKCYDVNDGVEFIRTTKGVNVMAQPIPRKAFDISEYQFSDNDIHSVKVVKEANEIEMELKVEVDFISLNKTELITMAKALGVTAEDFKQGG